MEANLDDPLKRAKAKAAVTYDAAADHFDDEPLGFWERIGRRTVARLGLRAGDSVLDVGCGTGCDRRCQRRKSSGGTGSCWELICPRA